MKMVVKEEVRTGEQLDPHRSHFSSFLPHIALFALHIFAAAFLCFCSYVMEDAGI